ncbi:MAG: NADH-quinone oxidoreductase subunit K [Candidatus Sumerlaeaceae bacterium]|nr:NADH-quinone oxidoreductase subunit K [Candidatus Sumerlaeaceae bacterium]
MQLLTALLVFILISGGLYLVMHRHLLNIILGVALLSHGTLISVLASSGWNADGSPPLLPEEAMVKVDAGGVAVAVSRVDPAQFVDPLPQALILTAIVIGFGVLSFLMVLVARAFEATGTMEATEQRDEAGE